jgi:hypothetical protein
MTVVLGETARDLGDVQVRVRIERYWFRCEVCGAEWIRDYKVRDYQGASGQRWVVHCRDGSPVPAPHFGDRCPRCSRVSVAADADVEASSMSVRPRTATG